MEFKINPRKPIAPYCFAYFFPPVLCLRASVFSAALSRPFFPSREPATTGRTFARSSFLASGRGSSPPLFLKPFPFSRNLSSLALPSLATTTGRAAAPSPLPARSIHQVCLPLLFHSAVRDGAPQTLTKLFLLGSESRYYNILPTNFDFVCKNVHLCPMLGPPLLKYAL